MSNLDLDHLDEKYKKLQQQNTVRDQLIEDNINNSYPKVPKNKIEKHKHYLRMLSAEILLKRLQRLKDDNERFKARGDI